MQKILMFSRNARAISGNVALNSFQLKNWRLTSGQPGRVRDRYDDDRREDDGAHQRDGDAPAAIAAGAHTVEQTRAPPYFKIGAPVAFASHSCWSRLSVPSARSELIALFTHAVSGLPFASTTPKRSVALPLFSNWPRILLSGHLHGRHVERGRQVDDEPVDLLVLQREHRAGVRREHGRLRRRLDRRRDERVARRAELRAELELLQAR